jgi:uncharacterized protein YndB with AHSA1/START domain
MSIQAIKHTVILNAPPQRVWQALTSPEEVAVWLGPIGFAPHLGHKFYFQVEPQGEWDGKTHSEIVTIDELRQLAFTWYVPGVPATLVTFTLRPLGDQTELTLEHTGWEQLPDEAAPIRDQLDLGWRDGVLPNLQRLLAQVG